MLVLSVPPFLSCVRGLTVLPVRPLVDARGRQIVPFTADALQFLAGLG